MCNGCKMCPQAVRRTYRTHTHTYTARICREEFYCFTIAATTTSTTHGCHTLHTCPSTHAMINFNMHRSHVLSSCGPIVFSFHFVLPILQVAHFGKKKKTKGQSRTFQEASRDNNSYRNKIGMKTSVHSIRYYGRRYGPPLNCVL